MSKYSDDTPLDGMVPSKSNYMSKEDAGEDGLDLTIKGFAQETVGDGPDADERTVCYFEQDVKPMVINKTNMHRIGHITGAKTAGEARGKKINVFNDPFVEFGGKMTGGLRIRPVQVAGGRAEGVSDDGPNW